MLDERLLASKLLFCFNSFTLAPKGPIAKLLQRNQVFLHSCM